MQRDMILDEVGTPVFITDADTKELLYMNSACMRMTGVKDYASKHCYEVLQDYPVPCLFCRDTKLEAGMENSNELFSIKFNHSIKCIDNLITYQGHRAKMSFITEIDDNESRENELRTVLDTERNLVRAIQAVNASGKIEDRLNRCLEICGNYYGADRAYICQKNEDGTITNTYEWCKENVIPQIENLDHIDSHYIDRWLTYFDKKEAVIVSDIESLRESYLDEYTIMTEQGIVSYMEAPLISAGELIGFIGVDNPDVQSMKYSSDLLMSLAYTVCNAVVRNEDEIHIKNQNDELESLIDNIPVGISMIRARDGKPIKKIVNNLLCEQYGIARSDADSSEVIAMSRISDEDRSRLMEKMKQLLVPGTEVSCDFQYSRSDNEPQNWYQMKARSVKSGNDLLLFSCLVDRTQEKSAEDSSAKNQKIYEIAAELGNLKVWTYDVVNHRIEMLIDNVTSKDIDTFKFPNVYDNIPEGLRDYVDSDSFEHMSEMYRALDSGVPSYECEYRYNLRPGVPEHWERVRCMMTYDSNGAPSVAYAIGMNVTEEHQARERYQQSIQTLMEANPEAIGFFRLNLTTNRYMTGQSGVSCIARTLPSVTAEEFFEHASTLIVDDETRANYLSRINCTELLAAAVRGESNISIDYRSKHDNNEKPWVRAYFSLFKNPDTGDIECVTYALDITKQVLMDRCFHKISDQEYDYVALLYPRRGKFEFMNLSSKLLLKYHKELVNPVDLFDYDDIRKFAVSTFIAEEDRELYLDQSELSCIKENLARKDSFEINIRGHYTGRPNEYMYRKIQHYYLDETKDTILMIQLDTTDTVMAQKKEAEMIKAEAEHVKDILDSMSIGVAVHRMVDANHLEVEFVNAQMLRLFGFDTPEDPEARNVMQREPAVSNLIMDAFGAIHPDDVNRVKKAYHEGFNSRHFSCGNYRIVQTDGSIVWVNHESTLREIKPDGHIFYATYRIVNREVELQAEIEKQLQNEKYLRRLADAANAAKSDFLSRMSHDMRTPLNGIIGMTYLTQEMQLPDKARDNLSKIDLSSKFLLNLINDVLDMTKAESGKIELHKEPYSPQAFFDYLKAVILPLCNEKNITFVIDATPVVDYLPLLDSLRINQIFFNLLSNAVKFTPEGGTVTYRLNEYMTEDGKLALDGEVEDTGIGMSEGFLEHVFEPFSQEMRNDTSEQRGTGLGLSIVKKLLDLMDCTIKVTSKLGVGTSFKIHGEFDCVPADSCCDCGSNSGDMSIPENCHILLCEDHPLNQEIVKTLLNEKNVYVSVAEDGREGVKAFAISTIGYYDAILMDIRMPVMDGVEATVFIRGMDRDDAAKVPIIAMTADAFAEDVERCISVGMNEHIAKPIDPQKLYAVLHKVISQARKNN